tara:strand:- start:797 stop:1384 length:588 start_codon:yes stop_codon:yes gene_type:complete
MADRLMCGEYPLDEVVSSLQKCIRRGLETQAMYWALELIENNMAAYLWRRLAVTSVEDCDSDEVVAHVWACYKLSNLAVKGAKNQAETNAVASAILRMCRCEKSREACDLDAAVSFDRKAGVRLTIPDFAKDMHTKAGKDEGLRGSDGITAFCIEGRLLDRERPNKYRKVLLKALRFLEDDMIESIDELHKEREI